MVVVIFAPVIHIITNHADMSENIDIFTENVFLHEIGLHPFILDAVKQKNPGWGPGSIGMGPGPF